MASVIKIKKGLDINLKGKASDVLLTGKASDSYAIVPDSFNGIVPKVTAKVGDKVKAGSVLMTDKNHPEIKFVSPVSGEVSAVNRGEKRKVLSIVVKPDAEVEYVAFGAKNPSSLKPEEIKEAILEAGMWPFIKQRPYDIVASTTESPRDIFVSTYYSAPLAPSFEYILKGQEADFQTGLNALAKLTSGKVYVGVKSGSAIKTEGAERVEVEGPHPAGNVGVLINHTKPVNKGETVWTINPDDVILIGRLFNKGVADFTRLVALCGSETSERGYIKTIAGCTIRSLTEGKVLEGKAHIRIISGNVLTGHKVTKDDYLHAYDNQVTVIPEGDDVDEFAGWAMPGFNKYSTSRTYFSWLLGKNKEYVIDARIRGGKRAMIMSNEYDKVFPMDIYPEYLLKAIIAFDIDKMENLGIYEVAPEDFALCEFVDTSKIEIQKIVRNGLNLLYKEMN
ncbi:Na+-transporting NADH:ubiquinone oxidoreductase subunit A [Parabacteroides sp. PF5-5]|uniref:Na(+)-translocating NADH-quinone reductase subunit A n=1 Tax=unclassified Parabacteroides TaxID=2649774 RepID=UPI002475F3BC|nr:MULTISPECIES: Na(+)-translocating NADH-quinone reductase subunit A [unclassified Parabacteroides]MDH6303796.1 Na+-transporting NADH:ubiquinone oxidoreductase subunit A [Parabacteroides sp. PH5-39]MDH6314413.1 Na+-transporting NADH:ubiquinone oxidoreductase subunit A [Parabacteroides sp. PF5-13]MDH6318522.1 Na+-transporting NADH:ubiquinone oxidoreductase subunit A [Parabacteroides sp. PH5-13]MDH6322185.1 Na+-transporting NADH:ubiquinone oxidoreductase subunit A [Parabacteroides sp. PH5-8]MDH